ncbi:MAG: FMN-binding protein [Clostridia bacterium]|nr:FMN-binding protein [Clostridia bacterium]
MTTATKNTVKSVIVLSLISVICVGLLAMANGIFPKPDTSAKLDTKTVALLNEICYSESYDIAYGTYDEFVTSFNDKNGTNYKYINALYRATGDTNHGRLIVEAVGNGYQNGTVTVLVAYNIDKTIMAVELKSYDKAKNNYMGGNLVSSGALDAVFENLKGSSGNVGSGKDLMVGTGATNSLNGVANAINFANKFIESVDESALPPIVVQPLESAPIVRYAKDIELLGGQHE